MADKDECEAQLRKRVSLGLVLQATGLVGEEL